MNLLCFLISLCACTSSVIALAARQGDGLDLIFDSKTRQRVARYYNSPTLVADLASKVSPQEGLRASDKISKLPGQPAQGVGFNQYAGYVSVDQHAGRALFYYFVEAAQPEKKPLLLWLNGGPGCSSFGVGAMEELGPFRVMSDGKTLYLNPYSWNKAANVLFLESPAGVGFSYSNTTSDYRKSGDQRTSDDAYIFLVNWLERFPEYKGRDFYIAGESYAGHYVPQLAQAILQHNIAAAATTTYIHLKGIMIGNAVINDETDSKGMYDFFWTHALISDETIGVIHKDCDFSPNATQNGDRCQRAIDVADKAVFGGDLDVYNIYAPLCTTDGVTAKPKTPSIKNFDPCSSNYVTSYLNDVEVQRALHANVTNLNYTWSVCSQVIPKWNDSPSTVLPLLKEFLANGIRVLVYSGDMDARVPVTSSRYSVNELKLAVKSPWNSWKVNGEVGGYNVIYDGNLTFATVRGAGHEVPSYQGLRGLVLVESFLASKPLPT